jgi:hypothetical protein
VLQTDIAAGYGDGEDPKFRRRERKKDGERVVCARIAV